MTAAETLKTAAYAGLHIELDGTDLVYEGCGRPPADLLQALARHKAEIIDLLQASRPRCLGDEEQQWEDAFSERVAIVSHNGVPYHRALAFAALQCSPRPQGMSEVQWDEVINRAGLSLDSWLEHADDQP